MKAAQVQSKLISSRDPVEFNAALNAFLRSLGESEYVDVQYICDAGLFTALVLYTS